MECISNNALSNSPFTNTFTIELTPQILDCSDSLVALPFSDPSDIVYSPITPPEVIVASYESLFTHTKKVDCIIDKCELKTQGCINSYLPPTPELFISAASLYQITAISTNKLGY